MIAPVSMTGPAVMASQTADVELDAASVEKGKADGLAKAAEMAKAAGLTKTAGETKGSATASATGVDPAAYAYGQAVGMLTGTLKTFNHIASSGSYNVQQWKVFTTNMFTASVEALKFMEKNPPLAKKYEKATTFLRTALTAINGVQGSLNARQWLELANQNKFVLETTLRLLGAPVPQSPQASNV
jgi:hypothetical protein